MPSHDRINKVPKVMPTLPCSPTPAEVCSHPPHPKNHPDLPSSYHAQAQRLQHPRRNSCPQFAFLVQPTRGLSLAQSSTLLSMLASASLQ